MTATMPELLDRRLRPAPDDQENREMKMPWTSMLVVAAAVLDTHTITTISTSPQTLEQLPGRKS